MSDFILLYFFLTFIVFIQSIVGVGVLVVGTPILLIFDFDIIEIIKILLPISIFTSLINIIIILKQINFTKIILKKNIKYNFFLICIPSVFLGLYLLKQFKDYFNFNLIVSLVIFLSILLKIYQKEIWKFFKKNFLVKNIMFLIGIIHGVTNSGGTLLALFFTKGTKGMLIYNRYSISFFYFFLGFFQFLIFVYIFKDTLEFQMYDLLLISSVILGILIGNGLIKYTNERIVDKIIIFISLVSALTLIIKI
jgi:uncharacterized membrane protein YfcA